MVSPGDIQLTGSHPQELLIDGSGTSRVVAAIVLGYRSDTQTVYPKLVLSFHLPQDSSSS